MEDELLELEELVFMDEDRLQKLGQRFIVSNLARERFKDCGRG